MPSLRQSWPRWLQLGRLVLAGVRGLDRGPRGRPPYGAVGRVGVGGCELGRVSCPGTVEQGEGNVARTSIRARLVASFSIAILIPSLTTVVVAVLRIREQTYAQAEARVASDLAAASQIYHGVEDRLKDAMRIHGTRRTVIEALGRGDVTGLGSEMERVMRAEKLDVLTLIDTEGKIFFRTRNPAIAGDSRRDDPIVRRVLEDMVPASGTRVLTAAALAQASASLVDQARMKLTETPHAAPSERDELTEGMLLEAAAPVLAADGHMVGVLLGGVLLNRNDQIVDRISDTVFRHETYEGRLVGTATIFQDDVRISTNVMLADGTRAISTRASGEVARAVLGQGQSWRGRAFVVNEWHISAYEPIRDPTGRTIGMLYVGILERPYTDSMWRHSLILGGISLLGVLLVGFVAISVAQRISRPMRAMAEAAQKVAEGDYSAKVAVVGSDEIAYLGERFNRMTSELARAQGELREWGETLERKVEQRTAEIRAIQSQMLQAEKLAAIGKLAAGVAHEINNPLTGVLTNASLLLQDAPEGDPTRADLQTIVDETMRCRKIVKGLLEFSRQAKPHTQPIELNQVVEDVLGLVKNQASFRNIALETALDRELPAVMADRDQLRQVVLNIVLNAGEAMTGGGRLRIASAFDRETAMARIEAKDTGCGIPEQIQARMFEPFYTTKKTGTGLGLAIAYGIVEEHKGRLRVDSAPGRGTTMIIELPALPKSPAAEPLPPNPEADAKQTGA